MNIAQQKLLELATKKNLRSMTLRETGSLIGVDHPQVVKYHLNQLIKKGLIKVDQKSEKIKRLKAGATNDNSFYRIPILGSANCGEATYIAEEIPEGMLLVSRTNIKGLRIEDLFALKAVGNSMNRASVGDDKARIENGDYVLIDKAKISPANGQYVLSIIEGLANIKKFMIDRVNRQAVLISESTQHYPPIHIHEDDMPYFRINGTVVKVIKKLS